MAADVAETETQLAAARADEAALPELAPARDRAATGRTELAELRSRLIECRSAHDRLQRESQARAARVAAIEGERRSWGQRIAAAERQLELLAERRTAANAELEELSRRPAEIAERRQKLMDLIDTATARRRAAADQLAAAETQLAAAVLELKAAEARLAEARENRVRAEAAVAQADEHGSDVVERIRERLECAPEETAGIAELKAEQEPPVREQVETRLDRLLRERDAIGPVNLRAEPEAAELEPRLAGLRHERADLTDGDRPAAPGIATLDREGRERLLAAFERGQRAFRRAVRAAVRRRQARTWRLTEADDPLEAGLDIMAQPAGQAAAGLSLLSGGEQALTAIALIFAVFLTNPAPICVLDEVDAPLDDANVDRFCRLVDEIADATGDAVPGDHPSPRDDGADGPAVRRDDGRARRLAAGLGRSRARRRAARGGVARCRRAGTCYTVPMLSDFPRRDLPWHRST